MSGVYSERTPHEAKVVRSVPRTALCGESTVCIIVEGRNFAVFWCYYQIFAVVGLEVVIIIMN